MLAEITAEAQHRDRRARLSGEPLADFEAVVRAVVDHQHDLEASFDLEAAQRLHQLADRGCAVVDGHDDGKRRRDGERLSHRAPPRR
jgi:hypothetical protein